MKDPETRRNFAWLVATVAATGVVLAQSSAPAPPVQQPSTFRTATLVVPLDVRVVDRYGKPITGLTAADFGLTEDGVRQKISQFVPQPHVPGQPSPLTMGTRFRSGDTAAPVRRTFLLILGRGRLQDNGKGVDGALELVRSRLLPQDHVAVLAWDRATPFTTDHKQVVAVLERFMAAHEDIEARILSTMSGLAGVYGSRAFPPSVRASIDAVFGKEGVAATESVVPNASDRVAQERRARDALISAEVAANRKVDTEIVSEAEATGVVGSFDAFVEGAVQSTHDLTAIYRGIDYLKFLDGEKHIVYISPAGFTSPIADADDDRSLAAVAADARVVIDIIMTGGTRNQFPNWHLSSGQLVATQTGGMFTSTMRAPEAVDRLDAMSRHSYLLGYTPTNTKWDLKYRRVEVRVNRPGARVSYRHGYFGRPSRPPMDATAVLSLSRISAGARVAEPLMDIPLSGVLASPATGANGARQVLVEFTVPGAQLTFGRDGDQRTAKFDLAVFIGDEQHLLVGQTWQTVDLKVDAERYARYVREGIPITLRIPIRRSSSNAKVIVYDYTSELLGSVSVNVKKKPGK